MHSPKEGHCLKGSVGESIFLYAKNDLQLYGYCDSYWEHVLFPEDP